MDEKALAKLHIKAKAYECILKIIHKQQECIDKIDAMTEEEMTVCPYLSSLKEGESTLTCPCKTDNCPCK